jgi:hypothetical protein
MTAGALRGVWGAEKGSERKRSGKDRHAGFGMLANYGRCTRPSVGGFFYSRQGEATWARGILSRGVTTVSPY